MGLVVDSLPSFPWDALTPYARTARSYPGGIVDLSVGTPVDPTPALVQEALRAAADSPGYPVTHGTPALREAVVDWFDRRRGVPGLDPDAVLPTVGSKEFIALLPAFLGLGPGDVVVHPGTAYPTYDLGARLVGARPVLSTEVDGDTTPSLIWLNSPGNPTGRVLGVDELAAVVDWARSHGAIVASDECYAELAWDEPWAASGVPSILDPRVTGGSTEGLLAVYSLSKQSNLAGYRAAFTAGDPALVGKLLELRKHAGMMMPGPVQAAATAALGDDAHVIAQRGTYGRRRAILKPALESAGYVIDGSHAGLYLWVRPDGVDGADETCWQTVGALADLGILVAPGSFYGAAGRHHVRVALTAADDSVAEAAARLRAA